MIPELERARLLALARESIAAWLAGAPRPDTPSSGALAAPAGAFVTLRVRGDLRGCIGHIEPDRPLADVVASCAVSAASADPRFPPLTPREYEDIEIEVSVLSRFEPVHAMNEIEIGRHGLLIKSGWRRGLLLPQVAPEWGWDAAAFVAHTCQKAGVPTDAWPNGGATLLRFEAEVFGTAG